MMQESNQSREVEMVEEEHVIVPAQHSSGWVDSAVMTIATACNLCDAYAHDQVRFEWDNEESDVQLDSSSFDDVDRKIQIEVFKTLLFDESSIRLDALLEDEPENS
jgi:hypothetical protein